MLDSVSHTDLLFDLGLKLAADAYDLLCHITAASVLMARGFSSVCCELFGAAFVFAIYVLRGEAVPASAAFNSLVAFTKTGTNATAL